MKHHNVHYIRMYIYNKKLKNKIIYNVICISYVMCYAWTSGMYFIYLSVYIYIKHRLTDQKHMCNASQFG